MTSLQLGHFQNINDFIPTSARLITSKLCRIGGQYALTLSCMTFSPMDHLANSYGFIFNSISVAAVKRGRNVDLSALALGRR